MFKTRLAVLGAIALSGAALIGCDNKVTSENFDKVTTGMTKADVEHILGPGTEQVVSGVGISDAGIATGNGGTKGTGVLVTYTWKKDNNEYSVTYKDGKVATKGKF